MPDEPAKEEDHALGDSPKQHYSAERRRSLWYAAHYPTDERKVSHGTGMLWVCSAVRVFTLHMGPGSLGWCRVLLGCREVGRSSRGAQHFPRGQNALGDSALCPPFLLTSLSPKRDALISLVKVQKTSKMHNKWNG